MNDAADMGSDMFATKAPPGYMHIRRSFAREPHIVQRPKGKGKPIKPKSKKAYSDFTELKLRRGIELRKEGLHRVDDFK